MMDSRVKSGVILGAFVGAVLLIPAGFPLWMTVLLRSDPNRSDVSLLATGLFAFFLLLGAGAILGAVVGGWSAKRTHSPRLPKSRFHSFLILLIMSVTLVGFEVGFLVSPVSLIGLGSTATSIDMWVFSFCIGSLALFLALFLAMLALAGRLIAKAILSFSKTQGSNS